MQGNVPGTVDGDGKPSNVKEKLPIKRSKGSLGSLNMITGKTNEVEKTPGTSANGAYSKRYSAGFLSKKEDIILLVLYDS